ncbi:MAG: prephenate dehydrogenase/arogenate dehydrogenase family protein, partial [Acidobacteriota bacterium]
MAQFKHIAIIGVGLIGGSFALALRAAGFEGHITGWDSGENLAQALATSVIDAPEESFAQGKICQADLIYLAAPIGAIIEFLARHRNQIKASALVSDSGSTKRAICEMAMGLPPEVDFIGGHPMAGSEQGGVAAARADLFVGATYILGPSPTIAEMRVLQFELLLRELGAQPVRLTASEHDEVMAMISHL